MLASPVQAAHLTSHPKEKPVAEKSTTLAAQDVETTGSIKAEPQTDQNCARSRMRLFVEGEGWIVRKVTTCY